MTQTNVTVSNLKHGFYQPKPTESNGTGPTPISSQPIQSNYVKNIAKSMTIDEMRELHQRALDEAEAKETELRLVLASRYRELVGSSDEVLDMQCRAKDLDKVVNSLPGLVEDLVSCVASKPVESVSGGLEESGLEVESGVDDGRRVLEARRVLSSAPRVIHSCLDRSDVHGAATALIEIFTLISSYTDDYVLANVLSDKTQSNHQTAPISKTENLRIDPYLHAQMKMIFLHVQTLPARTIKLSRRQLLLQSSSTSKTGCQIVASALSALNLLDANKATGPESLKAAKLMDLYFDSKAKLIHGLLGQMCVPTNPKDGNSNSISNGLSSYYTPEATDEAEQIISKIIRILQYDVILHPHQIFILRRFTANPNHHETSILSTLPKFDEELLKTKASNFLAAHLPLIRTKVKSVLVAIAGTTASRLGHIRQSLYDKTDGIECRQELDGNGVSTWDEAVAAIVDVKIVTHGLDGMTSPAIITTSTNTSAGSSAHTMLTSGPNRNRKFSLWGTLFSNTFSSLVHSLLSASFHSVHSRVVATLRASLANAPALTSILPHEAYRNSLRIATDLDASLKKVSDDAHELLVHAEERDESERRLRQSLYVQTCEIMGRLINELRRMVMGKKHSIQGEEKEEGEEAAKELIVGRLCHLLKFRLTTLPTLLDPNSSPAVLAARAGGKVGMISVAELKSAFEITDDNGTGFISFDEAMDAMEGAFSGTHFHGAEMVRETMLLAAGSDGTSTDVLSSSKVGVTPRNLTLLELVLLSARGLRHEMGGPESALGTIQRSLNDIVQTCFAKWAHVALSLPMERFRLSLEQFMGTAYTVSDAEWKRLHNLGEDPEELLQREIGDALLEDTVNGDMSPSAIKVGSVSTHIMSYLLSVTSVLNQSICPTDSLQPFPSCEYASAMGIDLGSADSPDYHLTMIHTLRSCLLQESLVSTVQALYKLTMAPIDDCHLNDDVELKVVRWSVTPLIQLYLDLRFLSHCFFKRNIYGFTSDDISYNDDLGESMENSASHSKKLLEEMIDKMSSSLLKADPGISIEDSLSPTVIERNRAAFDSCDLFFSSIFGKDYSVMTSAPSAYDGGISSYAFANATLDSPPLMLVPLVSSRRFTLLPIQAERSVTELQLLGNIGKDKIDKTVNEQAYSTSAAASAVSSGFGFLSSMLKKK